MQDHITKILDRDPDYLDRLITEIEAAGFLGYSVRALQNWRVRGGGPEFVKVSTLLTDKQTATLRDNSCIRFGKQPQRLQRTN